MLNNEIKKKIKIHHVSRAKCFSETLANFLKNYSEISYISKEISQKIQQGKFEVICVKSHINIG
jgi:hypothetical protein